ncbi:hypothetical protein Hdeb2414_s0089g00787341 [Helianthus debilis subsp. tardiflorus]
MSTTWRNPIFTTCTHIKLHLLTTSLLLPCKHRQPAFSWPSSPTSVPADHAQALLDPLRPHTTCFAATVVLVRHDFRCCYVENITRERERESERSKSKGATTAGGGGGRRCWRQWWSLCVWFGLGNNATGLFLSVFSFGFSCLVRVCSFGFLRVNPFSSV